MIKECMEIFEEQLRQKGEALVLDNHIPKAGTYLLVCMSEEPWRVEEIVDIKVDKKTGQIQGQENFRYPLICWMDYYSKLVEMNKPVDSSKIIHTNNYLAFAVKKEGITEGKLTEKVIDGYYEMLAHPEVKYGKGKKGELYQEVQAELGEPDRECIEKVREWIKAHLKELTQEIEGKDYFKIFFILEDEERTRQLYKQEGMRYMIPNIYNSNDYNVRVEDEIYGLPNNNMGMNAKKPYLAGKGRKCEVPCLLGKEEAIRQMQFFDYLWGWVSKGYEEFYFDEEYRKIIPCLRGQRPELEVNGYYVHAVKEKNEVEIQWAEQVTGYKPGLTPPMEVKQLINTRNEGIYGTLYSAKELEGCLDQIFFSENLKRNYYTKSENIAVKEGVLKEAILESRDCLREWFQGNHAGKLLEGLLPVCRRLVLDSAANGYYSRAGEQLNLMWSMMDYEEKNCEKEENMKTVRQSLAAHLECGEEWQYENDEEYFYAVGQIVSYFLYLSKTKKKNMSVINPILNTKKDEMIKKQIRRLFQKYNYQISHYHRKVKQFIANIQLYEVEGKINPEMILAGICDNNLLLDKRDKEEDGNE